MTTHTKTFTGKSFAECRGQWSAFCNALPDEPWMTRTDAHRVGGLYELRISYLDRQPDEDEPRGPYEPVSYREDMIAAGRGHLLGG
jgi:hypothetical protein